MTNSQNIKTQCKSSTYIYTHNITSVDTCLVSHYCCNYNFWCLSLRCSLDFGLRLRVFSGSPLSSSRETSNLLRMWARATSSFRANSCPMLFLCACCVHVSCVCVWREGYRPSYRNRTHPKRWSSLVPQRMR